MKLFKSTEPRFLIIEKAKIYIILGVYLGYLIGFFVGLFGSLLY